MIIGAIKLISKATTVIWVAKKGYVAYQAGSAAYKTYKQVKNVKHKSDGVISGIKTIKKVLKDNK